MSCFIFSDSFFPIEINLFTLASIEPFPVDSLFIALKYDQELLSYATKKRIALLSPTQLHLSIKMIENLWRIDGQREGAKVVYEEAQKLVDKHLGHPNLDYENKIYCTTGSLGQGITVGVGAAIASPNKNVYVSISDGECAEGSVWESLRYAQEYNLKNMHVHVNLNGYACYDPIDADYLERRLKAFMPRINIHKTSSSRFSFLRGIEAHYIKMDKTMYDGACKELNDER